MNSHNPSVVKHQRTSALLRRMPGARPHPFPCELSGSQKILHARIPYSLSETAPRIYPWRTSVLRAPQKGQIMSWRPSKNRSIASMLSKNRCIQRRIHSGWPPPRPNPHGTQSHGTKNPFGRRHYGTSRRRPPSRIQAASPTPSIPLPAQRLYGSIMGNNTGFDG